MFITFKNVVNIFMFIRNEKNMANEKKEHYIVVERLYWQVLVMTVYEDQRQKEITQVILKTTANKNF